MNKSIVIKSITPPVEIPQTENWIADYDVPAAAIKGHIVRKSTYPNRPIASLYEGGGTHGKPYQRAATKSIAAHPHCVRALVDLLLYGTNAPPSYRMKAVRALRKAGWKVRLE